MAGTGLVCLAGCATQGRPTAHPADRWLADTGFVARVSWASTVLHLAKPDLRSEQTLSALLRDVPDIEIKSRSGSVRGFTRIREVDGEPCDLAVLFNGSEFERRSAAWGLDMDTLVRPRTLDGLELHFGSDGPVHDATACGSLLLWSQDLGSRDDPAFRGDIRGRVRSTSQDSIVAVRAGATSLRHAVANDGSFEFVDLLPGEYELVFETPNATLFTHRVRVYAYDESWVELEVGR